MAALESTPFADGVFKIVFESEQNSGLLRALVLDLMDLEDDGTHEVRVLNPEVPPPHVGGKSVRHDLLLEVDGSRVNVEIQRAKEIWFMQRSGFYWARQNSLGLRRGQPYDELKPVTVLAVLGYRQFDYPEYETRLAEGPMGRIGELVARGDLAGLRELMAIDFGGNYDVRYFEALKAGPLTGGASEYRTPPADVD